ncbi:hypothetical protein [Streptomyces sp. NRRL S-378]|uniref:hypothetical protein n=1 Tax=Streptomyces sp. NRRL S-378 TaxID=1463904 RepID=UPI00131EAADE|nr:hypothetical protein [Streptomyces sp. NRRL S-378]
MSPPVGGKLCPGWSTGRATSRPAGHHLSPPRPATTRPRPGPAPGRPARRAGESLGRPARREVQGLSLIHI